MTSPTQISKTWVVPMRLQDDGKKMVRRDPVGDEADVFHRLWNTWIDIGVLLQVGSVMGQSTLGALDALSDMPVEYLLSPVKFKATNDVVCGLIPGDPEETYKIVSETLMPGRAEAKVVNIADPSVVAFELSLATTATEATIVMTYDENLLDEKYVFLIEAQMLPMLQM